MYLRREHGTEEAIDDSSNEVAIDQGHLNLEPFKKFFLLISLAELGRARLVDPVLADETQEDD